MIEKSSLYEEKLIEIIKSSPLLAEVFELARELNLNEYFVGAGCIVQTVGIDLTPYLSVEEAIDSWPTTASSLGVRHEKNGEWMIYAPYGLEDLFQLNIRANKKLITEDIYKTKYNKWTKKWPELNVLTW